jgi:hypothetical protein
MTMEIIQFSELNGLSGGSLAEFITGVCAGWGAAVLWTGGSATANPVGAFITTGCVGWCVFRLLS